MIRRTLICILAVLLMAACQGAASGACQGQRRPANPYGSVLNLGPAPTESAAAACGGGR